MIFTVTVRATEGDSSNNFFSRESAETWADLAYSCENVYSVEMVNAETGEIIWYKAKG